MHTMQIGSWCNPCTQLVPLERTPSATRLWTERTHTDKEQQDSSMLHGTIKKFADLRKTALYVMPTSIPLLCAMRAECFNHVLKLDAVHQTLVMNMNVVVQACGQRNVSMAE